MSVASATQRLTTTDVSKLTARGVDGVAVESAHARLRTALSARLGASHALLFATPERNGGMIAWSTPAQGAAAPLTSLDAARRGKTVGRIEQLLTDIRAVADRMQSEPGPARQSARLLQTIATPPAAGQVWVVDEQPVIVLWTHEPAAAPPSPPPRPAAAVARGSGGRTAPVLVALAALPCLAVLGWLAAQSPAGPPTQSAADAVIAGSLRQQLADLSGIDPASCRAPRQ